MLVVETQVVMGTRGFTRADLQLDAVRSLRKDDRCEIISQLSVIPWRGVRASSVASSQKTVRHGRSDPIGMELSIGTIEQGEQFANGPVRFDGMP